MQTTVGLELRRIWFILPIIAILGGAGFEETSRVLSNRNASQMVNPADSAWTLVWHDEFIGDALDTTKWVIQPGLHAGAKNERQYYTDREQNVRVEDGNLVLEARKEAFGGLSYTSARVKTEGRASWTYGRIEARIKIPSGAGFWPAFWMLGDSLPELGWPRCGEIDIMEHVGKHPNTVFGTIHGPGYASPGKGGTYSLVRGSLEGDYHIYSIDWSRASIKWAIDGVVYKTVNRSDVDGRWVFDQPFFVELNLGVGGNWPGDPNAETAFPQAMLVDYVRVYQRVP